MKIVLLTPIPVEYAAVRRHLTGIKPLTIKDTLYETGSFAGKSGNFEVIIEQTGPGVTTLGLASARAVANFSPQVIILTGVAGGVKDVGLGDIIVGNKYYKYETGKVTAEGMVTRPDAYYPSSSLIALAKMVHLDNRWQKRATADAAAAKVFFGPVASGEKVIAATDSEVFRIIKERFNDTLAVEMEAGGFGQALKDERQVHAINIRGISDLLNNKSHSDGQGWQEIAADRVAAFVFELIYHLTPESLNMDTKTIAAETLSHLLPVLQQPGGPMAPVGMGVTAQIYGAIAPSLETELAEIRQDPSDTDLHGAFRTRLKKVLEANEELQKKVVELLEAAKQEQQNAGIQIVNSKNVVTGGNFNVGGDFRIGDG